ALDQARYVRHHEALVRSDVHDAEVRMQGRERIVGDPRSRCRHGADESRLPRVRQSQQPDVSDQLELEAKLAPLAWVTRRRLARRAIRAALEPLVAKPALATSGDQ